MKSAIIKKVVFKLLSLKLLKLSILDINVEKLRNICNVSIKCLLMS